MSTLLLNFRQFFADVAFFSMFAVSNKPKVPGETFHQTSPTAVKGHYGSIASRPI